MHPSRSALRRRLAAVTAVALASGASVLLPAPVQANSLVGQLVVQASSSSASGTCSGTGNAVKQATIASSGTLSRSVLAGGTVTDSGDAADVSTWSSSASMTTVTQTGVPSLSVSGKISASVDAQQDDASDCNVTGSAVAAAVGILDLDSSGWISIDLSHSDGTIGVFVLTDMATMQVVHQGLDQETRTSTIWVGAGSYQVQVGAQVFVDDRSTSSPPRTVNGTVSGTVRYLPSGAAAAAQSGSGSRHLKLGNGVNCTDRQVLGIFSGKARALRTATFLVNGKKQRTVKNPSPGSAVVLRAASPTSRTSVKALLVTKKGKKLSVSRSYLACL
jgi:hypothetical protein